MKPAWGPRLGIVSAFVVLVLGFALAEMWVRTGRGMPARQIVRGYGLHSVDGVPPRVGAGHGTDRPRATPLTAHIVDLTVEQFASLLEQRLPRDIE
jgi:hypothetical protein